MSELAVVEYNPKPIERATWRDLLTAYLATKDSARTRDTYRAAIEAVMNTWSDLDSLTPTRLTAHREPMVRRLDVGTLSPASVSLQLAALRGFLEFAHRTGQLAINTEVIRFTLKSPKATVITPYNILSDDETARLLASAAGRDRAMLALLDGAGLRIAELCAVKLGDLATDDEGDLLLHVKRGKGRKDRLVPLRPSAAREVSAWLAQRNLSIGDKAHADEWLFPSRKQGGKLTTVQARRIMAKIASAAHIAKRISPHSLRHTYAMRLLRKGAQLGHVQKLLGHANLSTTQRYTDHLELSELKATVMK
jgi:site-specific recombinase XerD